MPSLVALTQVAEVPFAVCQPDRPAGRGLQNRAPQVKLWAIENGIDVIQPTRLKDGELARRIRDAHIDLGVVLAYGRLLPQDLLDAPKLGCVNLHASLLPRHRGAAPIAWAILCRDTETGVSLMQMDAGLDTGPVICQRVIHIDDRETAGRLSERISRLCAETTREQVPLLHAGNIQLLPQDPDAATWAPPIRAADRQLNFGLSALDVDARVRALNPAPGALTSHRGRNLRVLETLPWADDLGLQPGTIRVTSDRRVLIATSSGHIELIRAQFEGKKPLGAAEIVNGRSLGTGDTLGA